MKQRIASLFAGALFALALLGVAAAGPLEDGDAANQRGDYAAAMRLLRPMADGVPRDYAQAAKWFREAAKNEVNPPPAALQPSASFLTDYPIAPAASASAPKLVAGPLEKADAAVKRGDYATALGILRPLADKGDTNAQIMIGNSYWNGNFGNSGHEDNAEAIKWWGKAADRGNPEAQSDLGAMYFEGAGVPQDFATAAMWYLKAANHGYRVAQDRIGAMYEKGQGVGHDFVQAHMWFNLAAANEKNTALRRAWIADRNEVAAKMTLAQIAEAQWLASEWKPK